MQRRREDGELVPIDVVVVEEALDLLCHLPWRATIFPVVHEALEHGEWTSLVDFSQATECGEFVVCHAHVLFVISVRVLVGGVWDVPLRQIGRMFL